MATYTHLEVAGSPATYWGDLDVASLSSVDIGGTFIVLNNADGSHTHLNGTGLTVTGSGSSFTITGGTITSLQHTSSGFITFERITGLNYPATSFQGHLGEFDLNGVFQDVLSGGDTFNGYSGNDIMKGFNS